MRRSLKQWRKRRRKQYCPKGKPVTHLVEFWRANHNLGSAGLPRYIRRFNEMGRKKLDKLLAFTIYLITAIVLMGTAFIAL
jgi:hypothetical protein